MSIAAVVPVKALGAAKSRLGAVLSAEERAELALWLLDRVVAAVSASGVVAHLAVVSPDAAALDRARAAGAVALRQMTGDLGAAVEQGRRWALDLRATALLVVLGDLPLLRGDDVRQMIGVAGLPSDQTGGATPGVPARVGRLRRHSPTGPRPRVVLAPDRAATGTNAVLLQPPDGMPLAFGAGSYTRHLALAQAHGVMMATYRATGTAFDVDGPADLDDLVADGLWPAGVVVPGTHPSQRRSGDGPAR